MSSGTSKPNLGKSSSSPGPEAAMDVDLEANLGSAGSSGTSSVASDTSSASKSSPTPSAKRSVSKSAMKAPAILAGNSTIKTIPKPGPQRTSRVSQKLKILPDEPLYDNEESGREVYSQVTKIKETPARKDAERLSKTHRKLLPRVTAYCTAGSYKLKELARYMAEKRRYRHTAPKMFDECLYTPFTFPGTSSSGQQQTFIRLDSEGGEIDVGRDGRTDLFFFDYGVVVMWGFSVNEESAILKELERFEVEKLADEDIQVEEFNYYITNSYQPRIYNDFITLRDGSNYMLKLSISHAIAQSVKISLFEELVDNTIEDTQELPQEIALTGKVNMTRKDIMKSIGELFILRININLHGSVLDSPEIMWAEPYLEPIYQAARGYLEINQRVALLNQRLEVISDLLQMLKEQLGHSNEEYFEFIVIVLIGVQVLVAVINVIVDIVADITAW